MCLRLYNSRNKRTIISQANALKALDGVRRAYGWMDLYGTVGFESTGEVIQWQLWWWIKTWVDMGGIWELECELGWGWRNEAWIPKSDYANRNERFVGLIFKEEDEGGREIVTTYVHFFFNFSPVFRFEMWEKFGMLTINCSTSCVRDLLRFA